MREKKFMCGDCKKCFTTTKGLAQHWIKGRCKNEEIKKCPQ